MNKQIYKNTVAELSKLVKTWGKAKVYLVGGCVRDSLMGVEIKDIDLMVDLENGHQIFCDWLKGGGLIKDFVIYPRFGTAQFNIEKEISIECVATRQIGSLKGDAEKRDFCCNALYQDLETGEILDPTEHGIEDIKSKILRTPISADQTFRDDPLRMLRAFRFWAERDFVIHPEVMSKIKPYQEYGELSLERVNSEFTRILRSRKAVEIIRDLHRTSLLGYILPEFEEAWGFNQNTHYHSMNLTDHSLAVLERVGRFGINVKMAALLHDISKYKTWKIKDNGEFSYPGHDIESAKMSVSILQRLMWSKEDIENVGKLISKHMILKPFRDPITGFYNGSSKVTRRIVRELEDDMRDCLGLINADNLSHSPSYNMPSQVPSFYKALSKISKVSIVRSCPVSGDLIMETFKLKPGPVIKEIKEVMLDWLDEDPTLNSDQLVKKFGEEYGGKGVWVWSNSQVGNLCATFTEPVMGMDGEITTHPFEYPYQIEGEINGWKEWWSAIKHPKIYSAVNRSKKARAVFYEAAEVLKKLEDIPGFRQAEVGIDLYNDISGTIEWEDLKPDYIL